MNISFFNNVLTLLRQPSNKYTIAYPRILLKSTQMRYGYYMNFILSMSRQISCFSIRKYILNVYAIKAGYDKKINVHFLT